MTVEIWIGESAGDGEGSALDDVNLVVQMGGTLLEDVEVHRELVPQVSEHAAAAVAEAAAVAAAAEAAAVGG